MIERVEDLLDLMGCENCGGEIEEIQEREYYKCLECGTEYFFDSDGYYITDAAYDD